MAKAKKTTESLEKQLFKAADKLRNNIDAAEYKHVVLGLIFLKYISDSFSELYNKLMEGLAVSLQKRKKSSLMTRLCPLHGAPGQ